jgi:hypothetical protein
MNRRQLLNSKFKVWRNQASGLKEFSPVQRTGYNNGILILAHAIRFNL